MLNARGLNILEQIIKNGGSGSIKELSGQLNISERAIRYDIDKIDGFLTDLGLLPTKRSFGGIIEIPNIEELSHHLKKQEVSSTLEPKERVDYILHSVLFEGVINLAKLCEKLDISRTTIKGDLKQVKKILGSNLTLDSLPKAGLTLTGEQDLIRGAQLKFLVKHFRTLKDYRKEKLHPATILTVLDDTFKGIDFEDIKTFINYVQKNLGKIISYEAYEIISCYIALAILEIKRGRVLTSIPNENFLKGTDEFKAIIRGIGILEARYEAEFSEVEILQITDYLLGSHTYNFNESYYKNWVEIEVLVKKLIENFNMKIDVDISGDEMLLDGLINHIKPTIYRSKNNISLENSIVEEVIKSYPTLFNITNEVVKDIEDFIEVGLSQDEVAFLTIHFKAAMDRNRFSGKNIKNILLVCGLGYGSSKLLAQQLKEIYSINIVDIIPKHLLDTTLEKKEVDFIITTLDIKCQKPYIKVNPILTPEDIHILDKYSLPKYRKKFLMSDLLEIIEERSHIKDREKLIEDLEGFFDERVINNIKRKKLEMIDILSKDAIKVGYSASNWEEAILESGRLLEITGATTGDYTQSMGEVVKEYGGYIVIADEIAIPHARNNESVMATSMGFLSLKEAVEFPGGKKAKYLFPFSSLDNKEHLNSLVDLMDLITQDDIKGILQGVSSFEDLLKLIYKCKLK